MTTNYPGALDTAANLVTVVDNVTTIHASDHNYLRDAAIAIETELGVLPKGNDATVVARLNTLDKLFRNLLSNGSFDIWQRGTTLTSATAFPNSDDNYIADRWNLVSDGNDAVDVSRSTTTPPTGHKNCFLGDQETANKQWGIVQFIENLDAVPLRGKTVSLSFQARTTAAAIGNLRAAILEWDSTADAVTSDVVGTWHGAGTDPTWAANWTAINVPSNLALTTTFQTFKIEGVTLGTTLTNLAVIIWVDDTTITVADYAYITGVQLEVGTVATAYAARPYAEELRRCQRYFWKTFTKDITPAQSSGSIVGALVYRVQVASTTAGNSLWVKYPATMFAVPTVVFYSTNAASTDWWSANNVAASGASSSAYAGLANIQVVNAQLAGDAASHTCRIHATFEAEL
jgi:hypothetical protein